VFLAKKFSHREPISSDLDHEHADHSRMRSIFKSAGAFTYLIYLSLVLNAQLFILHDDYLLALEVFDGTIGKIRKQPLGFPAW